MREQHVGVLRARHFSTKRTRSLFTINKAVLVFFVGALHASTSLAQAKPASPELVNTLRHNDELLLTAIHRGDRATWARLTTSDFMYVEEGDVTRRDQLLRELEEDGSLPLIIRHYEVQVIGDTAQVFHRDDVPQRPGRPSTKNAHLLMTETWQRVDGKWLLRLVHTDRIRIDPPAISLTARQIDELVGTYRGVNGTYVIQRSGNEILGIRDAQPAVEIKAETRDVLFTPGDVYMRKIFQRDATGRVTGFVDRDENTDRVWIRSTPQ